MWGCHPGERIPILFRWRCGNNGGAPIRLRRCDLGPFSCPLTAGTHRARENSATARAVLPLVEVEGWILRQLVQYGLLEFKRRKGKEFANDDRPGSDLGFRYRYPGQSRLHVTSLTKPVLPQILEMCALQPRNIPSGPQLYTLLRHYTSQDSRNAHERVRSLRMQRAQNHLFHTQRPKSPRIKPRLGTGRDLPTVEMRENHHGPQRMVPRGGVTGADRSNVFRKAHQRGRFRAKAGRCGRSRT